MKDLQDRHAGKMGFVIGASPSLHNVDPNLLKDYVTITVNSGVLKIPNCDYFLSDDIGAKWWNYWHDTVKHSNCIKLLFEDKLRSEAGHFDPEKVVYFKHKWWFQPPRKYNLPDGLIMTKNAELPIIGARTSAGSAVHMAYIMGCDPIVLLGCDCCYGPKNLRYFWQYPGETKAYRINGEPVFCHANNGKMFNKTVDHHCVEFMEYWTKLAKINQGTCNIVYASEGGILSCFPVMTLNEVLAKYGERKR